MRYIRECLGIDLPLRGPLDGEEVTDLPGSVPVLVRCGCPDRRVPLHLTKQLLGLLVGLPGEFPCAVFRCRVCRMEVVIRVGDLPVVRLAS